MLNVLLIQGFNCFFKTLRKENNFFFTLISKTWSAFPIHCPANAYRECAHSTFTCATVGK